MAFSVPRCTTSGKGRQRQQFVEDEKGEQVRRHGDAHRRRHTQAEEAEKTAAVRRAFEVADGVERGEQPEDGGQGNEQHAQCVGLERQFQAGQHRVAHAVFLAGRNAGQQQGDQAQLGDGGKQVEGRAQADPGFRQREDDQSGQQRGRQYRQRQEFVAGQVTAPDNRINSTPRRPSSTLAAASAKALHSRVRDTGRSVTLAGAQEEGLTQHAQDIDGRQQAAGQHHHGDDPVALCQRRLDDQPFGEKARGRRQPHQGHAGKAEGKHGHRQALDRAGQTGHRILPGGLDQHAGGGEHAGLGQAVGEHLHHAGLERAGYREQGKDQEQVAELRHRRISDQAFQFHGANCLPGPPRRLPRRRAVPAARRRWATRLASGPSQSRRIR
jgi:hypothetical protein